MNKYVKIKLNQLFRLTDRFIYDNSIFNNIINDKNILQKFNKINSDTFVNNLLNVRIILKYSSNYLKANKLIGINETLISTVIKDIICIVDIEDIIALKVFYMLKKLEQNVNINILFIEHNNLNRDLNFREKQNTIIKSILFSKDNASINSAFFNDISKEEFSKIITKERLSNKSLFNHFFTRERKAKIIQNKKPFNFRLNLILKENDKYLDIKDLDKSKDIKIIHCPVCVKSFDINTNKLFLFDDNKFIFNCNHEDTQFEYDYKKFSFYFDNYNELRKLKQQLLAKYIKHNVQPIIINNSSYGVKILMKDKVDTHTLKRYIINKSEFNNNLNKSLSHGLQIEYNCPVCSEIFNINFNFNKNDHYLSPITNKSYGDYKNDFYLEGTKIEFLCGHQNHNTTYKKFYMYKKENISKRMKDIIEEYGYKFDEKSINFINLIAMISNYKNIFLDGKKVIKRYLSDSDFEIIDLSSYLND